jgi:phage shock protein A
MSGSSTATGAATTPPAETLQRCPSYRRYNHYRGWAAQWVDCSGAIRGFFGSLLTGVEQRNPEILLETAVQDELNNLKKLQVAAARTMAYEKMLANDAASKQKVVTVKERQARELAARGQREAAIEVVQQKQEAQTSLAEIEGRLEEARENSEEMEQAFREQERRYNDVVRERAALMEEHQRARALRTANEARANISLSDSSRDLEQARQAIRQASYEAEAVRELGTSETERQIAAAEADIKRLDAEREPEMIELQRGLRDSIEAGEPSEEAPAEQPAEEAQVEQPGEEGSRG